MRPAVLARVLGQGKRKSVRFWKHDCRRNRKAAVLEANSLARLCLGFQPEGGGGCGRDARAIYQAGSLSYGRGAAS